MPVHSVSLIPGGVRVCVASNNCIEFRARDFPGNRAAKAAGLKQALQDWLDVRQPIADLSDDDPDKTIDPARPGLFWDAGDLVSRPVLVTGVTVTGSGPSTEVILSLRRS